MLEAHERGPDIPGGLLEETVGANLRRVARLHPDREAIVSVHQGCRMTYAQLDRDVDDVAKALLADGVARGDRVGIWSPNCLEWMLLQYATARVGAILVNINPSYRSHELEYALRQSGSSKLFSATEFRTSNYRAMIEEVRPALEGLEDVVYVDGPDWDEFVTRGRTVSPAILTEREATLEPSDPINIQYTSGTTGFPKGATLSHRNILNNGNVIGRILGYGPEDRVCIPVPLYHCFGMVIGNLAATTQGSCVVYPAPTFDPEATLTAVEDERCTSLYGVPTMFIAELELPDFERFDLSTLRTGVMAGSPCPEAVMRKVQDLMGMAEVTIAYGMTETSPVSTQTRRDDDLARQVTTVGRVHPGVEIKIVDPVSGETLERGQTGEFCTHGYSVMLGYWQDPEKTADAIDSQGWMHTGDLATMDEDGYCQIVGRIKDMVIRGGENLYPREIEEFLYTLEGVSDAQVVGVPDQKYGEELCAWIIRKEGHNLVPDEIRERCREQLAHFKVPRYVLFTEELPLTVTGKVRKFELRDQAIEQLNLGSVG